MNITVCRGDSGKTNHSGKSNHSFLSVPNGHVTLVILLLVADFSVSSMARVTGSTGVFIFLNFYQK